MRRALHTLTAAVTVALLALSPAGAEELAPTLSSLTASAGATGVTVAGAAAFAAPAVAVAEDSTGDARVPQAGMDLAGASITQLSNALLRFQIDVADQTPVLSAAPQAVYYNWNIAVQTGSAVSSYNIQAMRADMYSVATAGAEPGAPVFRLQTCVPNAQTGGQTCSVAATLTGAFGDGFVAIDVPASAIGAKAGSTIGAGSQPINANPGAGAVWFNGDTAYGDSMVAGDYVMGRTVTLGAAPAGTAPQDVPLTQPAALTSANKFTQLLTGAQAGDVIAAEVCAAGVCTLTSTIAS